MNAYHVQGLKQVFRRTGTSYRWLVMDGVIAIAQGSEPTKTQAKAEAVKAKREYLATFKQAA